MTTLSKKESLYPISAFEQLHTSGAGYDTLRYVSLPKLLGKESHTIMYFMGKTLAESIDFHTIDDIIFLFKQFGWGTLNIAKEKKKTTTFYLLDDSVVQKLQSPIEVDFRYEAGFLAKACSLIYGSEYECIEKVHKKIYQVEFTVVLT